MSDTTRVTFDLDATDLDLLIGALNAKLNALRATFVNQPSLTAAGLERQARAARVEAMLATVEQAMQAS